MSVSSGSSTLQQIYIVSIQGLGRRTVSMHERIQIKTRPESKALVPGREW